VKAEKDALQLTVKDDSGRQFPVRLSFGQKVTCVSRDGKAVDIGKIKPGRPVAVYYAPDKPRPVVEKVVKE
jgi:hypothetical protein